MIKLINNYYSNFSAISIARLNKTSNTHSEGLYISLGGNGDLTISLIYYSNPSDVVLSSIIDRYLNSNYNLEAPSF